jgi:hypothetical protein
MDFSDFYHGIDEDFHFGLLDGVSLALSNLCLSNNLELGFPRCIRTNYNTFNYMKCGLQIMLEIDFFGNNDIHSLRAFVTKMETQPKKVLLI